MCQRERAYYPNPTYPPSRLPWAGAGPAVGAGYIAFAGTDCTGADLDKNSVLFYKHLSSMNLVSTKLLHVCSNITNKDRCV